MINKKFNNTEPDIWFANHNFIIENDEGNHESYDSNYEKKEKACLKSIKSVISKSFDVITMILVLIFLNF